MQAVFTGSLTNGFTIRAILADHHASNMVELLLANGEIADAIQIQSPTDLDKHIMPVEDGLHLVVYGKGLGNGFKVVGPFGNSDDAEDFAEEHRGEDDEWEIFDLSPPTQVAAGNIIEILQHQIRWSLRSDDAPGQLDQISIEHIEKLIKSGFNQGEFCVVGEDGVSQYRGRWSIISH